MRMLTIRLLLAVPLLAFLVACAADRAAREAAAQMKAGQYEQALATYGKAIAESPDSALLASQRIARAEVASKLLAQAAALRRAGQPKQAEVVLRRLLALEPANERANAELAEIERDLRQVEALDKATRQIAAKEYLAALATVEEALRDGRRNLDLLGLQRRIELELRAVGAGYEASMLSETRPVTLDFRDANLRMLLEAISRSTGIDFVLDKDVRPDLRVTVFLRNARLDEALDLITNSNQLARKVLDPRTVLIYPNTPDKVREHQDLLIRAFFLANTEAKQLAVLLRSVLKVKEPFVDEKLNLVVLREAPETIRLAERLIALVDVGEPEVMMEVEVLEVKSTRLLELGIQFPETFVLTALPPAGSTGLTLGNFSTSANQIGLTVPPVVVNLRRETGDVNLLANPRVRAKNREKARVLVGDKLPVVTTTATATGLVSESVSYLDVGIKVEVEPQVTLDDDVSIRVSLEVSNVIDRVKTSSGGLAYTVGTRTATTTLRLRDGETQALAGLISRDDRNNSKRVPGLGDLPYIGRLFRSELDDSQRTEIVLSITPRIIRNVRRPDHAMAEFWSGSELVTKLRSPARPAVAPDPVAVGQAGAALRTSAAPGATAVAISPRATAPSSEATLSWKLPATVKAGETFEAEAVLGSARPLRGLTMDLQFDATLLELVDVTDAGYLAQKGSAVTISKGEGAAAGRTTLGAIRNATDGVLGEGSVLKLKFRAKAPGQAFLAVESANPVAIEGSASISLPQRAQISVQ